MDLTGSFSWEPLGLFPISLGQCGGEIPLRSSWLETLIIITVLHLVVVLCSARGSMHLLVMLSDTSRDYL